MPVEAESLAVRVRVEDALPPAGTVTGLRRLTAIPSGAAPLQAAERLTVELNPSTEESTMVVDFTASGDKVITAGNGWVRKSGFGDEARTVPVGVTISSRVAVCDNPPLEAVTVNGYVPVATVPET